MHGPEKETHDTNLILNLEMDESSNLNALVDEDKLDIKERVRFQLGEDTLHVPYKVALVNKVQ
jgi:hypothetical protein